MSYEINLLQQELSSILLKKIQKIYLALPKQHKIIISSFSIFVMLLLLIPSEKATASKQSTENSLEIGKRYQLTIPQKSALSTQKHKNTSTTQTLAKKQNIENSLVSKSLDNKHGVTWQTATVKNGDSLAKIFKRFGFNARTTHDVSNAKGKDSKLLKKLNVGDKLQIGSLPNGKLAALTFSLSKTETLHVDLVDDEYHSFKETKTVEIRESFAQGTIKSSFWNAGIEAGLDDGQIINLANVFGWDIDFALDIREGDSFHVLFENKYIDGEFIGTGKILAAEFINQDDPFQAIRFDDGEYYSPDGKSMHKAFLRAPVNFKYISSNFKRKRLHPVTKRWKAHRGTDYAARTGTPVVAAGNGKVTHSTRNKYNGNYVFLQHGNGIVTKYLHFSKRAVKKGQRVKQGQIIGYVGATGQAAGPHLHYEFLLNGVHRNPRTVKLPDAKPLDKKHKNAFSKLAKVRLNELATKKSLLAMNADAFTPIYD